MKVQKAKQRTLRKKNNQSTELCIYVRSEQSGIYATLLLLLNTYMNAETRIIDLTVEDLINIIRAQIPQMPAEITSEDETYLTTVEAAKYASVSLSTIRRWSKDKYIHCSKKGGILRYRKNELDKILN